MDNAMEMEKVIETHLTHSAEVLAQTVAACSDSIRHTAELIVRCFQKGGKLMICGNGGSAAESQHMAAELTHRLSAEVIRPALPALALTTDTSFLTACSNDDGYEHVFSRQIQALGREGDVLLGLSTSGNSRNVVAAFQQARAQGITCIALAGTKGEMVRFADEAICIPAAVTQSIQEAHLAVVHILCALVESAFVAPPAAAPVKRGRGNRYPSTESQRTESQRTVSQRTVSTSAASSGDVAASAVPASTMPARNRPRAR